jgi:D-amino-acid dehydrogenase
MKVIVLGSGVIGTMTAWYLLKAGHEATVIDRQPAAAPAAASSTSSISSTGSRPCAAPGRDGLD